MDLPAKQHCQFSPFTSKNGPNGLNCQCCLAGSSKTAPRILILSIAIDADYSFDIKGGFSVAPAFSLHKNFDTASVEWFYFKTVVRFVTHNALHLEPNPGWPAHNVL